jgi:hypothetical protein
MLLASFLSIARDARYGYNKMNWAFVSYHPTNTDVDDHYMTIACMVYVDGQLFNLVFYHHFIISSSDDESDCDTDILMASTTFINEHNESQLPKFRGLTKPRKANLKRNRLGGHLRYLLDLRKAML